MSKESKKRSSKKRSLSYRVSTPEERARRQSEIEKRSERIMSLKAQGLNFSTIAVRMGLSSSSASRIAREHARQLEG